MAENNPTDKKKEALQGELMHLLATAHGEIKTAAEKIAGALDALIKEPNHQNRELFKAALASAITVPKSLHFDMVNADIRKALIDILEHATQLVDADIKDLVAANEKIKQEKKKLKERIEEQIQQTRGFRR